MSNSQRGGGAQPTPVRPGSDPEPRRSTGPGLSPGRQGDGDAPTGILVIADTAANGPTRLSKELLGLARRLEAEAGANVSAAYLTSTPDGGNAEELIALGADRVHCVEHPALDSYHSEAWVSAAAQLAGKLRPALVLLGHTSRGADLAPRLAFRLQGSVATGCIDVSWQDGSFCYTRPCHGGNVREVLSFESGLVVATFRAGYAQAAVLDASRRGTMERFIPALGAEIERVKIVERRNEEIEGIRLEDAPVIVAGGRGLNGAEGFGLLQELAGELSGAVGASRVPCDLGWCPRSWQIGLTGRTVHPDLYIAVGISGAGHHMAGCGNARTIVAVNTDPDAAIFRDARFGIVSDYRQFIPALISEVRKLKAQHPK